MSDVVFVVGGEAGQGLNVVETILIKFLKASGLYIYSSKEYMSVVRGGVNTVTIRVSDHKITALKNDIDVLLSISKAVVPWVSSRIKDHTLIIGEGQHIKNEVVKKDNLKEIELTAIAKDIGDKRVLNTIIAGVLSGILNTGDEQLKEVLLAVFGNKGKEVIDLNIKAFKKGYTFGYSLRSNNFRYDFQKSKDLSNSVIMSGADAISLGSIAAGCNYLSFYPMSPATEVALFFARQANNFDLVVEQFEDEISVINSAIGSWYAGGRAMVTTSGGGFDLMQEAISLSGMAEIPVVIHLGQRPGPSTGLPTRTMQSDFNLALYAGHGEFPRVILAPGTLEDAYYLSGLAFDLAARYQIPVFILTDQYLLDTYYVTEVSALKSPEYYAGVVEMDNNYMRYKFTENGVSPRGVPGYGDGIMICNGNEHDEFGDTTEDEGLSSKMQEKRNKKLDGLKDIALEPKLIGSSDCKTIIICWGSTLPMVQEAVSILNRNDLSILFFNQLFPVSLKSLDYLDKAEIIIDIEHNYTGQFGNLLIQEFGIKIDKKILKYNGRELTVEEAMDGINNFLLEKQNEK